jgi:hypothetical protein
MGKIWIGLTVLACACGEEKAKTAVAAKPKTEEVGAPPVAPAPKAAPKPVPPPPPEAPIEVTAKQLFADYQANEIAADGNYGGKLLQVTGKIAKISKVLGDPVLELATSNEFMPVYAKFASEAPLVSLKRGQQIVIRCRGKGLSVGHALLDDCAVAPSPPVAKRTDRNVATPAAREEYARKLAAASRDRARADGLTLVLDAGSSGHPCEEFADVVLETEIKKLRSLGFEKVRCEGSSVTGYVK